MEPVTSSLDNLKQADRSLYAAILYCPADKREAIATLHLFERETARIRDLISEPLPGEIRLQWWRDVIEGERAGEAAAHPLASSLLAVIERYGLSRQALAQMTETRIFDLYDDVFADLNQFEGYCGETFSTLFQACAQVLGDGTPPTRGDAAGHAGIAYGVSVLTAAAGRHRARGQVFLPAALLSATGGDREAWLHGDDDGYRARAMAAFVAVGQEHDHKARAALKQIPAVFRPAFSALALAGPVLGSAAKRPDLFLTLSHSPRPLADQWALMRFAFGL